MRAETPLPEVAKAVESLNAAVTAWPSSSVACEAERLVTELCTDERTVSVVVFGSAVRPSVPSFDVDLLYIYEGDRPEVFSERMEIDLRGYPKSRLNELVANGHDLICWSLKFGKLVCDRDAFWSGLKSQWASKLPLPSIVEAKTRSSKAWELFEALMEVGDLDAALEQYVTYLTHHARIQLVSRGIYPASRPELPTQLRQTGAIALAASLDHALRRRAIRTEGRDHRTHQFLAAARDRGQRHQAA